MVSNKLKIIIPVSGNILDWFDFGVFASLAPVLAKVFFPSSNHILGLLMVYTLFAIGFVVRPLGALVFGPLGDSKGRAYTLRLTLICMSLPSLGIALIPTRDMIGIFAPIILVSFRLIQGFAIGSEASGTIAYLYELNNGKQSAFLTSFQNQGANIGVMFAMLCSGVLAGTMSATMMQTIGWRIPFLIGGLLGLVAIYFCRYLNETHSANNQKSSVNAFSLQHFKNIWLQQRSGFLRVIFILFMTAIGNYTLCSYLATYLHVYLGYSLSYANFLQSGLVFLSLFLIPVCGFYADKWGQHRTLLLACSLYIIFAIPCFYILRSHHPIIAILPILIAYCFEQGTAPAIIDSQFDKHHRFTALAITYNITLTIVGGTTPLVQTFLIKHTHNLLMPAIYLMFGALVTEIALLSNLLGHMSYKVFASKAKGFMIKPTM